MAKLARERLVQERRALKRERKHAAAAARQAEAATTGEASEAIRELKRFIAVFEDTEVRPGSEIERQLDEARRALEAHEQAHNN